MKHTKKHNDSPKANVRFHTKHSSDSWEFIYIQFILLFPKSPKYLCFFTFFFKANTLMDSTHGVVFRFLSGQTPSSTHWNRSLAFNFCLRPKPIHVTPALKGQFTPKAKTLFFLLPTVQFIHSNCVCVSCRVLKVSTVATSGFSQI